MVRRGLLVAALAGAAWLLSALFATTASATEDLPIAAPANGEMGQGQPAGSEPSEAAQPANEEAEPGTEPAAGEPSESKPEAKPGETEATAPGETTEPSETGPGETTPGETTPGETTKPGEAEATEPSETTPDETTKPGETEATAPSETTPGETTEPSETTPGEVTGPGEVEGAKPGAGQGREPGEATDGDVPVIAQTLAAPMAGAAGPSESQSGDHYRGPDTSGLLGGLVGGLANLPQSIIRVVEDSVSALPVVVPPGKDGPVVVLPELLPDLGLPIVTAPVGDSGGRADVPSLPIVSPGPRVPVAVAAGAGHTPRPVAVFHASPQRVVAHQAAATEHAADEHAHSSPEQPAKAPAAPGGGTSVSASHDTSGGARGAHGVVSTYSALPPPSAAGWTSRSRASDGTGRIAGLPATSPD